MGGLWLKKRLGLKPYEDFSYTLRRHVLEANGLVDTLIQRTGLYREHVEEISKVVGRGHTTSPETMYSPIAFDRAWRVNLDPGHRNSTVEYHSILDEGDAQKEYLLKHQWLCNPEYCVNPNPALSIPRPRAY